MKLNFDIFYPSKIHPEVFVCRRCGSTIQDRDAHLDFHHKLIQLDMDVKDFMDEWGKKRH